MTLSSCANFLKLIILLKKSYSFKSISILGKSVPLSNTIVTIFLSFSSTEIENKLFSIFSVVIFKKLKKIFFNLDFSAM